jgi:tRNA modification GTPase
VFRVKDGDTIAAIVTPPGEGGIGIVRLSGPGALAIGNKVFVSPRGKDITKMPTFTAHYGHIRDPETGKVIDEVILLLMLAPRSYTREDVVEIHCHGGIVPLQQVFELVVKMGARTAEPGEFTKRAFLNGRLDLAQAEAVIDIVRAKTGAGLATALGQLRGDLSQKIRSLREHLAALLAKIEASIDFPEYDLPEVTREEIRKGSENARREVGRLLASAQQGQILREGLRTVILGKPNVGKSSLLNALLRQQRALVTNIPGTTRDVIEEYINIRGIPLRIMDTAGIRRTEDLVEKLGIDQTRRFLADADLVLVVLDAGTGWTQEDEDLVPLLAEKRAIVLINKTDIGDQIDIEQVQERFPGQKVLTISVKEGWGLEELEETIWKLVFAGEVRRDQSVLVSNVRHKEALEGAGRCLTAALEAVAAGAPIDLVAIDLKEAWEYLGEITGETVGEDLIDRIFSDFCIGK